MAEMTKAESMIMLALSALQSDGTIDQKDMADALRAATARVAELEERLPCGHRKVDWDDGHGGCAFCSIKRIHDAHENCPDWEQENGRLRDRLEVIVASSSGAVLTP